MLKQFTLKTSKSQELIDITNEIKKIVAESKVQEGICVIYTPHATAGILINENYDKGVCEDIINQLERLIPSNGSYKHNCVDSNAHAHIKSSIIGPSEIIIIQEGKLILGTWQGIALVEFDGAKERKVFVKIIKD